MPARQKRLSRGEMLDAVPRLNAAVQWRRLDSGQTLVAYPKWGGRPVRWLRRLFVVPGVVELLLDEVGSDVVRQIDGRSTVGDLIAYVADRFKLSRKEAEVALLKYLDMLGRRGLVGFEVRVDGGVDGHVG